MFFQQRRSYRFLASRRWLWPLLLSLTVGLVWVGAEVLAYREPAQMGRDNEWLAWRTTPLPPALSPEDTRWDEAPPLYLSLHAGWQGPLINDAVELRALRDTNTIAFRVRWSGRAVTQAEPLLALIWHKDDLPEQRGENCATACHIAQSDSKGRLQAVIPSFVPAGREESMPGQAIWRDDLWTLVWQRPLRSSEARDIQFVDLNQRYRVRVKVFLDINHKPDLLTKDTFLVFR